MAQPNQAQTETAVEQVIGSAIEILRIQKGDTVIVRADMTDETQMQYIVGAMAQIFQERGLGPEDVSRLIIPSNIDLKILSPEQMKRSGWERAARIVTPGKNGLLH